MLSRLLKRNSLRQITQTQLQFLIRHLVSNGNLAKSQSDSSPFPFYFFSSAASNLSREFPKTKEPIFDFFHSYGFTDPQINRFIHKCASLSTTETIKPKLEHLLAFGFSPSDLIKSICFDHCVLFASLKKRIEPNLKLLEATFGSKTHIIKAIINGPWLLTDNLEKRVIPNVKTLRVNNIPMDLITRIFTKNPLVLVKDPDVIIETISKLKVLGMSPSTASFLHGINAMVLLKKETWERKMELYRSFGWSEEDTILAFSRQPMCLQLSDDKIKKQMDFFIEKLQWDSAMVAKRPVVLMYSLEGRIIPRCVVLNMLAKRKLWNGKPSLNGLLNMSEKDFEKRYVDKYAKEVPKVIDAYQGKIDFVGFESLSVGALKL